MHDSPRHHSASYSTVTAGTSTSTDDSAANATPTALFCCQGVRVRAQHLSQRISWKPADGSGHRRCCQGDRRNLHQKIPYYEILAASPAPSKTRSCCGCKRTKHAHALVVHTFRRGDAAPCREWSLEEHVLSSDSQEQVNEWIALINGAVAAIPDRPRRLLVFVNPHSGSKVGRLVWDRQAAPVFHLARIHCQVIETLYMNHAKSMLAGLGADELASYDGIVAVGGDGLFQECMMGLLAVRHAGEPKAASTAARLRLGHIPAGSTDAVAWSLHGTRSVTAAALHIALGDRLSLDVGRADSGDNEHRFFVCQAAYGFLGDVMRTSERMRFLGPARYDVAGALMYLRLNSYSLELAYKEAPPALAGDTPQICSTGCTVCSMAGLDIIVGKGAGARGGSFAATRSASAPINSLSGVLCSTRSPLPAPRLRPPDDAARSFCDVLSSPVGPAPSWGGAASGGPPMGPSSAPPSPTGRPSASGGGGMTEALLGETRAGGGGGGGGGGGDGGGWVNADGEYASVMCVVAPCRSDKSKHGIIPYGHLSDGRMYLVLVTKCHHVDYLRFLLQLSQRGLTHLVFPFVRVVAVTAVQLKPRGAESSWNVDGELLRDNRVDIRVQRGAVEVFARSVDL